MLQTARSLGDELVVVISNDAHNRKPNAVPAVERKKRLEQLGVADRVVIGRPDSFAKTLVDERPSILVLGYDQRLPDDATARAVEELGVELVQLPWFPGKGDTCEAEESCS
jgi:glycerol-3-phosphate cytidylyltransferase-like family protein